MNYIPRGLEVDFHLNLPPEAVKTQILPWPPALRVAVIEASIKGKGGWKKGLPGILETMEALGRPRREGAQWRD